MTRARSATDARFRSRTSTSYALIIDTNAYAGNFERDICAYVCGRLDDSCVGSEYAAMYHAEHPDDPFEDLIGPEYGEWGLRHAEIWSWRDTANEPSSVVIHLERKPTGAELGLTTKRARAFSALPKDRPWAPRPAVVDVWLRESKTVQRRIGGVP